MEVACETHMCSLLLGTLSRLEFDIFFGFEHVQYFAEPLTTS